MPNGFKARPGAFQLRNPVRNGFILRPRFNMCPAGARSCPGHASPLPSHEKHPAAVLCRGKDRVSCFLSLQHHCADKEETARTKLKSEGADVGDGRAIFDCDRY